MCIWDDRNFEKPVSFFDVRYVLINVYVIEEIVNDNLRYKLKFLINNNI